MQFTTLLAATTSILGLTANAAVVQGRDGARLAQFRIFSAEGCFDLNQGFYTVDQSDATTCHDFGDSVPVVSVRLESLTATASAESCAINLYTDRGCTVGKTSTTFQQCTNPTIPGQEWHSWEIVCSA